jgi:hypothetical protein
MPYTIDKYNGQTIAVVEDGTIDTTLDIKLIGKNYAGYGEVQNENFVHLLENFAGANSPPRPISGQLWYDSATRKLKFYDSTTSKWKTTGGAEVSAVVPAGLSQGDFWYDSVNKQIYVFDGSQYILVGPQGAAGLGTTEMKSRTVVDTSNVSYAIIEAVVDGDPESNGTVFIISASEFTLGDANPIEGFTLIKQGITLANTGENGISPTTSHWGTASSAMGLVDGDEVLTASSFLKKDATGGFGDLGFTVGDSQDLAVNIDTIDGTTPIIKNQVSANIAFQTTSGATTNTPLKLEAQHVLPGTNSITDLGSSTRTFRNVHALNFFGSGANLVSLNANQLTAGTVGISRLSGTYNISITGTSASAVSAESAVTADTAINSDNLKLGSNYATASTSATASTIAARTTVDETVGGVTITAGSLKANYFAGIATSALFADLAEKYLADTDYEVGTVVCVGGDQEVTACSLGSRAIGAVSGNPAYMMNAGLEGGTFIALKGRVPVKVIGAVKKGDKLIAGDNGCAGTAANLLKGVPIKAGNFPDTFAVALESSDDEGIKFIEAIIL